MCHIYPVSILGAYAISFLYTNLSSSNPSTFILDHLSSSNSDNEDEKIIPPIHPCHLVKCIEPNPQWVYVTMKSIDDIVGDPFDHHHTCSQFQLTSSLLDRVLKTPNPKSFKEYFWPFRRGCSHE